MNSLPWGPLINPFMTPHLALPDCPIPEDYPREQKEALLKKMLPAHNKLMSEIARGKGISGYTLHNWREAARAKGQLMPEAIPALRVGDIRQVRRSTGNSFDESSRIHLLSTKRPVFRAACSMTHDV